MHGVHGLHDPFRAGSDHEKEHLQAARGRRHSGGARHGTPRGGAVLRHGLPPAADTVIARNLGGNILLLPGGCLHDRHVQA